MFSETGRIQFVDKVILTKIYLQFIGPTIRSIESIMQLSKMYIIPGILIFFFFFFFCSHIFYLPFCNKKERVSGGRG